MLEQLVTLGFEVKFCCHAAAILEHDFPSAVEEIEEVLASVRIPIQEMVQSGGGEAKGTQRLRRALAARGWRKTCFEITKTINGVPRESVSHEVDHVRTIDESGVIAMEIEWNNKDPFFDRDLENFKRLHAEGAISVGVILTRGSSLQNDLWRLIHLYAEREGINSIADLERIGLEPTRRQRNEIAKRMKRPRDPMDFASAWTDHFVSDKYGSATTHWRKLADRIDRGVGNPCPLLLLGIPSSVVTFDSDPAPAQETEEEA